MPRAKTFTEAERKKQLNKRLRDDPEPAEPIAPLLPFEEEAGDLRHRIEDSLNIRATYDLARELAWLLVYVNSELQFRKEAQSGQPTPGQMKATVESGAKYARQ